MKRYFEQINREELEEVFANNGYLITNSDQIFNPDREEEEERESLFVICKDMQPDAYSESLKHLLAPFSFLIGAYGGDLSYRIFNVEDYFIDEICAIHPEGIDEERLHNLNETYRFKMSCKHPNYKQDFEKYCETLLNEAPNDEMGA